MTGERIASRTGRIPPHLVGIAERVLRESYRVPALVIAEAILSQRPPVRRTTA